MKMASLKIQQVLGVMLLKKFRVRVCYRIISYQLTCNKMMEVPHREWFKTLLRVS